MSRTIETTVYTFDELSDEAKEKAIEEVRERGITTEFFHEDADLLLDWVKKEKAEPQGIDIREFNYDDHGYWHFDVAIAAVIDLAAFMKAHKLANKYRALYNVATERNPDLRLYDVSCSIYHGAGSSFSQRGAVIELTGCSDHPERDAVIEKQADEMEDILDEKLRDLTNELAQALNAEIEYKNSDEYIRDMIEGNEWEFTEDGEWA